jgi:hypothetical protein
LLFVGGHGGGAVLVLEYVRENPRFKSLAAPNA